MPWFSTSSLLGFLTAGKGLHLLPPAKYRTQRHSHELIGKFLAARDLRRLIAQGLGKLEVDYVPLSGEELWLDIFYFIIDEIDSARLLNRFLAEIDLGRWWPCT